jgi:hypothetical protein
MLFLPLLLLLFCIWFSESTAYLWAGKKFNIEVAHGTERKDFRYIRSREFLLPSDTILYSNGDKARKFPANIIVFHLLLLV